MQVAVDSSKSKPTVHDIVCFHCQQVEEKYFKALLHEAGFTIPYVHDLDYLLMLLLPGDASLRKLRRGLKTLTRYAVQYRYPGNRATARKAASALRLVRRVRETVRNRLGLDNPAP